MLQIIGWSDFCAEATGLLTSGITAATLPRSIYGLTLNLLEKAQRQLVRFLTFSGDPRLDSEKTTNRRKLWRSAP